MIPGDGGFFLEGVGDLGGGLNAKEELDRENAKPTKVHSSGTGLFQGRAGEGSKKRKKKQETFLSWLRPPLLLSFIT